MQFLFKYTISLYCTTKVTCINKYHYHSSAPTLTVTVNNATAAIAGLSHTLSCSVSGANFETATVMYTWRLNVVVMQGPSASNLYNIATDNDPIQVSDAGEVYSCEVTVTGASYWDVSGSFGGSGSATLSVTSKCMPS